jgi:hypothetical protein
MQALTQHYAKLKLRINETKSAVAEVWGRPFLGYAFWKPKRRHEIRRAVSHKAIAAMKERIRTLTRRNGGRSMDTTIEEVRVFLTGWKEYFRLAETPKVWRGLDEWIRHRLRAVQLKQWKRGNTIYRELRVRKVSEVAAMSVASASQSWWRMAGSSALNVAIPISYFDARGLPRLAA